MLEEILIAIGFVIIGTLIFSLMYIFFWCFGIFPVMDSIFRIIYFVQEKIKK